MKRALVVGCNYKGSDYELNGCINDGKHVLQLLTTQYGYKMENIVFLSDDQEPAKKPTRANLLKHLKNIVSLTKPSDNISFFFSGHGSQTASNDKDEIDHKDDTIVPLDFEVYENYLFF